MAVTWVASCPFDKTQKPPEMSGEELNSLEEYLCAVLSRFRQQSGFADPLSAFDQQILFELTERERLCVIGCIDAVLDECKDSPLELDIRVGNPADVQLTVSYLRTRPLAIPVLLDRTDRLHDCFSSICADLLSYEKFEPFLVKLFQVPPGIWLTVAECCDTLDELPHGAAEVLSNHRELLMVSHLPWPAADSDRYSLIQFVHSSELWSTIAQYNRKLLFVRLQLCNPTEEPLA